MYRMTIDGQSSDVGDLRATEARVMDLVTARLADNPESMAEDAQMINAAFRQGIVRTEIRERGSWTATLGGSTLTITGAA